MNYTQLSRPKNKGPEKEPLTYREVCVTITRGEAGL